MTSTTPTTAATEAELKPIRWGRLAGDPRLDRKAIRVIGQTLMYGAGRPDFIPLGFAPELDDARVENLRLLGRVSDEVDRLDALAVEWQAEDAEHEAALRDAHREGSPVPGDGRTSRSDREAAEREVVDSIGAAIIVLGEFIAETTATIREHEDEWCAALDARLAGEVAAKEAEARRMLDEARAARRNIDRTAKWIIAAADGGASAQPAPTPGEVPSSGWNGRVAVGRHWSKLKPWNAAHVEPEAAQTPTTEGEQAPTITTDEGDGS